MAFSPVPRMRISGNMSKFARVWSTMKKEATWSRRDNFKDFEMVGSPSIPIGYCGYIPEKYSTSKEYASRWQN